MLSPPSPRELITPARVESLPQHQLRTLHLDRHKVPVGSGSDLGRPLNRRHRGTPETARFEGEIDRFRKAHDLKGHEPASPEAFSGWPAEHIRSSTESILRREKKSCIAERNGKSHPS